MTGMVMGVINMSFVFGKNSQFAADSVHANVLKAVS